MKGIEVYIEGRRVDLFKDESINLKSSVQDINDISKVFADLSKSFSVPASKNNNSIFKHYYEADIINGFDARTKKQADIYLSNKLYKKGKIRLVDVKLNKNLVSSYQIQFEGEVIKIKDLLDDDKLRNLDFSAYNHNYTSTNIKQGLETSLFSGAIIYPLISPIRRFVYDSADNTTSNDSLVNIHYNASINDNSIDYKELKPAISDSAIISAIQNKYGLSFVGDFFNRDYFTKSYLWLNKDEGFLNPIGEASRNLIDWDQNIPAFGTPLIDLTTDILTVTIPQPGYLRMRVTVLPFSGFENVPYTYVITQNGTDYYTYDAVGTHINNIETTGVPNEEIEIKFFIQSASNFKFTASVNQKVYNGITLITDIETRATIPIDINSVIDVAYQMPDIKVYDYLVGLIKQYNIALTPNFDESINFDVLPEWYNKGVVHKGFEKYIDVDKKTIKRGKLFNEFDFKFEESETLLAQQFESNTGVGYGNLEARIEDSNGVLLDGSKLEIKLPFEQMVFERILDIDTNVFTELQYGYAVDKEQSPVVTKSFKFFNNNIPISEIGFLTDTSTLEELNTTINIPSNTVNVSDSTTQSNCFGAEISTYNFTLMENSLYNTFYKDYVTDMFSNQRRVYNFNAVIPEHILLNINLNDRLIILNKRYIINSIDSNLTTGKTKLELLNDIYESGDLITDQFYVTPNINFAARWEDTYTATVYSSRELKILSTSEGDGIFTTINSPSDVSGIATINYTVSENNTGNERVQSITIQDKNTLEVIKLFINQSSEQVDWSNNNITWDNNIITWDNNN